MLRPLTLQATEKPFSERIHAEELVFDTSSPSDCEPPVVTTGLPARDDQTRAICIEKIFFKLFCLLHLIGRAVRIQSEIYPTTKPRPRRGFRIS